MSREPGRGGGGVALPRPPRCPRPTPGRPHRGVLALHAAAVEAHGRDPLLAPLHPDHALVVLLARLWLRQVLGTQGKRLHDTHWDQEVPAGQDLRAALRGEHPSATHTHSGGGGRDSGGGGAPRETRKIKGRKVREPSPLARNTSPCPRLTSGLWTLPSWKEHSWG